MKDTFTSSSKLLMEENYLPIYVQSKNSQLTNPSKIFKNQLKNFKNYENIYKILDFMELKSP